MKAELVAAGWTLIGVACPAFVVALFTAMANSDGTHVFSQAAMGWCIALALVAAICGFVGAAILLTASALT